MGKRRVFSLKTTEGSLRLLALFVALIVHSARTHHELYVQETVQTDRKPVARSILCGDPPLLEMLRLHFPSVYVVWK